MVILQKYSGVVEKGKQLGKKLGFPTANIYLTEMLPISYGVYAVLVTISGKQYYGVANYGISPTIGESRRAIEVYIIDFSSEIYGQRIDIEFFKYIREERKFETLEELKKQIAKDVELVKKLIATL